MRIVCSGSFDPITQKELCWIRQERRKQHSGQIWIYIQEDGNAPYEARYALCEKAISPYRKIRLTEEILPGDCVIRVPDECIDEAAVRSGIYRLAAQGIRSLLLYQGIYLEETCTARCTRHRADHSASTAETAAYLAGKYGEDPWKMYIAGYLHDITKSEPYEDARRVMEHWYPEFVHMNPKVWHSFTADVFLRREMHCTDPVIRNAVRHHTLGDGNSNADRILYVADKIEPTRPYPVRTEWQIAERDLREAAAFILEETRQFIEQEEKHV